MLVCGLRGFAYQLRHPIAAQSCEGELVPCIRLEETMLLNFIYMYSFFRYLALIEAQELIN